MVFATDKAKALLAACHDQMEREQHVLVSIADVSYHGAYAR